MVRLTWHYKKSLLGDSFNFITSHQWDNPYIIRFNKSSFDIYDIRKYSNMKTIDFNFFGYSKISSHTSLDYAKRKVKNLYDKERYYDI